MGGEPEPESLRVVSDRFPLFTDADVHGPLIKALTNRGWDVVRSVDTFLEGTDDEILFEYAANLLCAECSHRMDAGGACRGDGAGGERHDCQDDAGRDHHHTVQGLNAIEYAFDIATE